jgi:beta-mannosidase
MKDMDIETAYWPSSPSYGWGRRQSYTEGDSHYWGLWHGNREGFDIESVQTHTGRFVSEYGMQSLPDWKTIEAFTLPEDRDTSSIVMKVHQKNPPGYYKLGSYINRYFRQPKDFESYAYVTQCLQAYALKYSIDAHRSLQPWCMGTLYWQLNDCWPVASWSSVDGAGRWKAAHYIVRQAYKPVSVVLRQDGSKYIASFIDDSKEPARHSIIMTLLDFSGKQYWEKTIAVNEQARGRKDIFSIDSSSLFNMVPDSLAVMQIEIIGDSLSSEYPSYFYFTRPKNLVLEKPAISVRLLNDKSIEVSSDVLARFVWLDIPSTDCHFSDNYFDLLPGEKKVVTVLTDKRIRNLNRVIRVRSLADTYSEESSSPANENNKKARRSK